MVKKTIIISAILFCGVFCFAQRASLPFPNHTAYLKGVLPNIANRKKMEAEVLHFFNLWKEKYIKFYPTDSTCYVYVKSKYNKEVCVSEGIGYGMMILVLMADANNSVKDKEVFDKIFRFYKNHPSVRDLPGERKKVKSVLMASAQKEKAGSLIDSDQTSAADGDIDIAYALLLAYKQWPSKAGINYLAEAKKIIKAIYDEEINKERFTIVMSNASQKDGSKDYADFRASDFIPSELRAFGYFDGGENWNEVIRRNYAIFSAIQAKYSQHTGLFADFYALKNGEYVPGRRSGDGWVNGAHYYYNACRIPWRIATDYIISGETSAKDLLEPINKWILSATKGNPNEINAGYSLDGKALKKSGDKLMMSFVAPLAVSAMTDPKYQGWLNNLWKTITALPISPGGEYADLQYGYYENTIKLLCMIMLSGNYWTPAIVQEQQ